METLYLVQVLLKEKTELCNYAYYKNYKMANDVASHLREDKLINADLIRVTEVKVYL